eukprot:scaffold123758_cov32-Prasinocladus_malaysianus.AAC.1
MALATLLFCLCVVIAAAAATPPTAGGLSKPPIVGESFTTGHHNPSLTSQTSRESVVQYARTPAAAAPTAALTEQGRRIKK